VSLINRFFGIASSEPPVPEPRRRGAPRGRRRSIALRDAEIRAMLEGGATTADIMQKFELSRPGVYAVFKREGVSPLLQETNGLRFHPTYKERNAEIIQKYKDGATGEAIAQEYGITRERVFQILRPFNLPNLKAEQKRLAREAVEAERETIIAEMKASRAADIERALEIVRAGGSRNDAIRATGLPVHLVHKVCGDAGLPNKHGRWRREREFEERKARIRALRAEGKTWKQIGTSLHHWAVCHMPELIRARRPQPPAA